MSCLIAALLGTYHGINRAMGWLFAAALGLQERRAGAVLRALPPIVLGHPPAVAAVLAVAAAAERVVPQDVLRTAVSKRHPVPRHERHRGRRFR